MAATATGALLQIDPITGNRTILSDDTHGSGPTFTTPITMTIVPNVPEPSTVLMAVLGLLGLLLCRGRWR